jgi:hypothetical protein
MSDPLENLFDETPETEAAEAQAPEQVTQAPAPEAPASDTGKGEIASAAPPAATDDRDQRIPITALLDEREKRQAAERRAQEIERRIAEIEAQRQQPAPDFFDNPEAAFAAERARVEFAMWNERANMSEMLARNKHGDETVERATQAFVEAAQANPALAVEMRRQRDPYGYVIGWHRKHDAMQKIGDDPDAWITAQVEARLAERLAQAQAPIAQPAPVQAKPNPPPRSIASAQGMSAAQKPTGSAFDELFPG